MGLPTLLGFKPRGFFIPYRYAGDLPPRDAWDAYPEVRAVLSKRREAFLSVLSEIDRHAEAIQGFCGEPLGAPRWDQDWFPRLDGAAAYALVRSLKPRRIVEVGSGHSTRFMVQALRDEGVECRFTAIDPAPRASLGALDGIEHVEATLQEVFDWTGAAGLSRFAELGPGDILFVDSSHILMPGSDVDLLLNRLLPRLAAGVIVHVHDVFLPDDYPSSWGWRGYNEQGAVALLLTTGAYEPLFASRFVATRMAEAFRSSAAARLPLQPGAHESSLWLAKRSEPVTVD